MNRAFILPALRKCYILLRQLSSE